MALGFIVALATKTGAFSQALVCLADRETPKLDATCKRSPHRDGIGGSSAVCLSRFCGMSLVVII